MIINLRAAMRKRAYAARREMNLACAALVDPRSAAIAHAFQLAPAAAWMVARMDECPMGLARAVAVRRLPRSPFARLNAGQALGPLIENVHAKLGADAIHSEPDGWRLTPLGRLRIRNALKEPVL